MNVPEAAQTLIAQAATRRPDSRAEARSGASVAQRGNVLIEGEEAVVVEFRRPTMS